MIYSPRRMESDTVTSTDDQLVHAYSRDAVDDFLAAAEAERVRLRGIVTDAEARSRRARAAVGMQRVMVSMLLETQREVYGDARVR